MVSMSPLFSETAAIRRGFLRGVNTQ
jgi:hypothetical protein